MKLDKQFIALQNKIERMSRMKEKTISRNYKATLNDLRKTLSMMYDQYEIDGQVTFQEMSKYNRLQKLDKEVYDLITDLYKSNTKIIRGTLVGIANETYNSTINIVEIAAERKLKGIVKELNVDSIVNNEMAGLKWSERVSKHRSDLIYSLNKEIRQGLTQGDTYATMTKRLKKELGTNAAKANTIVRTEGHRVLAETQKESLDSIAKQGIKMTKTWVTSRDERVRGNNSRDRMDHVSMDGITISIDENFKLLDGSSGYGPGLTNSYNDINCRCIIIMNIED